MIDYTAEIVGDQVVFTLRQFENPLFETYTSDDGFLSIICVNGKSDGWLGYGGLQIYLCDECLPLTLRTPHYEHEQDLLDVLTKIEKNMKELDRGDVLP